MKTLYQLEQEAKEARDNAIFMHGSESPLSQDIVDSFINAAVAMVTYQFALGMQEVSGDGSGESLPEYIEKKMKGNIATSQDYLIGDGWIEWSQPYMPTTALKVDLMTADGSEHLNKITDQVN